MTLQVTVPRQNSYPGAYKAYWMEKGWLGDHGSLLAAVQGPQWLSGSGESGAWQKSRAHQRLTQPLVSVPTVTHLHPSHL